MHQVIRAGEFFDKSFGEKSVFQYFTGDRYGRRFFSADMIVIRVASDRQVH
jgi:hypothetical protein